MAICWINTINTKAVLKATKENVRVMFPEFRLVCIIRILSLNQENATVHVPLCLSHAYVIRAY